MDIKFTPWECNIVSQVLGAQRTAVITEIETLINLRDKFDLKYSEKESKEKFPVKATDEDKSIHKESEKISLNAKEIKLIKSKLENGSVGLPVRKEAIDLHKKINDNI